jgi:hypothetical protein
VGHLELAGNLDGARQEIERSFDMSRKLVLRRNLLLTGAKLSHLSLSVGDIPSARKWLKFASGFSNAGLSHEHSLDALAVRIRMISVS